MDWVFLIASGIALLASGLVVIARNAVHAALYLVVSLLAVALVFFSLGAPFVAALEVIVYAGAILVMILFVIMLLNLGQAAAGQERALLRPRIWIGPTGLCLVLGGALLHLLLSAPSVGPASVQPEVAQVALGLFGPYVLGVELASMLLLAGLVGAYHLSTVDQEVER
jgi:NADH-quinone oxidoreductase subunit J